MSTRFIDLAGQRFGRLRVISRDDVKSRVIRWVCVCDCGTEKTIIGESLRSGATTSCGCFWRERIAERAKTINKTHGLAGTRIYKVWDGMIQRCENSRSTFYKRYGGRGITVCKRWRDSFESFFEDMGEVPFKGAQIDRRDNNGNYEPSNCRWVTAKENLRNRSCNRIITYNGVSQNLSAWVEQTKIRRESIMYRINKGWDIERVLNTPVRTRRT